MIIKVIICKKKYMMEKGNVYYYFNSPNYLEINHNTLCENSTIGHKVQP